MAANHRHRHRHRRFAVVLVLLLAFAGSAPLFGFRSGLTPSAVVRRFDESFRVHSQAEHYRVTIVGGDGATETGRMLILYRYEDSAVRGIQRYTPDRGSGEFILLSVQKSGELPRIFLDAPSLGFTGEVGPEDWKRELPLPGWHVEAVLDDDKEAWDYVGRFSSAIGEIPVSVVEARWSDPMLRAASPFAYRVAYFARDDNRIVQVEYFDESDRLVKTLRASQHRNTAAEPPERIRAHRLIAETAGKGEISIMSLVEAAYDIDIPAGFFAPATISRWGEETDRAVFRLIRGDRRGDG